MRHRFAPRLAGIPARPAGAPPASAPSAEELRWLDLLNAERETSGLAAVSLDPCLQLLADEWALVLDGTDRLVGRPNRPTGVRENVIRSRPEPDVDSATPDQMHRHLAGQDEARSVMLYATATVAGVAVVAGDGGVLVGVQYLAPAAPEPCPDPRPEPDPGQPGQDPPDGPGGTNPPPPTGPIGGPCGDVATAPAPADSGKAPSVYGGSWTPAPTEACSFTDQHGRIVNLTREQHRMIYRVNELRALQGAADGRARPVLEADYCLQEFSQGHTERGDDGAGPRGHSRRTRRGIRWGEWTRHRRQPDR